MKITQRPNPELLHAAAAALRVWLLDVCVWLTEWLGVKLPRDMRIALRRDLARAFHETRMLVLLLAVSRMRIPVIAARTTRPRSAPRGCRRARDTGGGGRAFNRGLKLHGRTLVEKLAALREVYNNLDRHVRRMLKHLRARTGGLAIVLVMPQPPRPGAACVGAPAPVDSS